MHRKGVLGIDYHHQRRNRRSHSYRLWRRGIEITRTIHMYCPSAHRLLDIGTADGLTVSVIKEEFPSLKVIGLDRSLDLLKVGNAMSLAPVLADAIHLPFSTAFDIVSATAVIEHLYRPLNMLLECRRVLRPGGICVVTTPDPFFDRLATLIGHLPDDQHQSSFTLKSLIKLFKEAGFIVVEKEKFMMSPIGFPRERCIESVLKRVGCAFLLLNQIVVAQRPYD